MDPTIIDVEASGFGRGSYPIEVGVALPDTTTHCFLIHPDAAWTHWDSAAEALHHIDRQTLLRHGRSPAEVAGALNRLLAGARVYSDAWSHDLSWLGRLHEVSGVPQRYRLESLRVLLSEAQAAIWHQTKSRVIEQMALTRHRASSDALIIQETLRRTREAEAAQASGGRRLASR
ncbi:MAG: hypothetical protein AB2813_09835 [Candidatus Sedimenticola endophacoides]